MARALSVAPDDEARRRRLKNLAVGLGLAGLCLLFYLITIVKLTSNASP